MDEDLFDEVILVSDLLKNTLKKRSNTTTWSVSPKLKFLKISRPYEKFRNL